MNGKGCAARATEDIAHLDEGMLADHIGFRVHLAQRAIRRVLRGRKTGGAQGKLPGGSISALELICRNPGVTPRELAHVLCLDPPKVTVMLRQLEQAGLVERLPSASDGRKSELRLSDAGRERLERSRQFSEFQEQRIARGLSPVERAELLRLLRKMQDAL